MRRYIWGGEARADGGAFMPPLIVFGSFLHQGKKEQDKSLKRFENRSHVCNVFNNSRVYQSLIVKKQSVILQKSIFTTHQVQL